MVTHDSWTVDPLGPLRFRWRWAWRWGVKAAEAERRGQDPLPGGLARRGRGEGRWSKGENVTQLVSLSGRFRVLPRPLMPHRGGGGVQRGGSSRNFSEQHFQYLELSALVDPLGASSPSPAVRVDLRGSDCSPPGAGGHGTPVLGKGSRHFYIPSYIGVWHSLPQRCPLGSGLWRILYRMRE